MFDLLTAPQVLAQPTQAHRYMVELVSNELDFEGVPINYKTVDVVVTEASLYAIAALLRVSGYLEDYGIVSYWIPEDCDCF